MKGQISSILLLFPIFVLAQGPETNKLFTDTSVYFINQKDTLHPVYLSSQELEEASWQLQSAIEEFNKRGQDYVDSIAKKRKIKWKPSSISSDKYLYMLTPVINTYGEKELIINGDNKDMLLVMLGKKIIKDNSWKTNFIKGYGFIDAGTSFIYLKVNLTLKTRNQLTCNGGG